MPTTPSALPKDLFLLNPDIAFLNHGSFGATPKPVFEKYHRWHLGLDMTEYLDIQLIARRTEVVGELIYYPFIVFFLMLVARNSFFDNWDWPLGLVLVIACNIGCAVTGAMMLRRAADGARENALEKMNDRWLRLTSEGNRPLADTMAKLIKEVESEKRGAFSLLSQYPLLAAILMPSGSIGIWALIEYFAKSGG